LLTTVWRYIAGPVRRRRFDRIDVTDIVERAAAIINRDNIFYHM